MMKTILKKFQLFFLLALAAGLTFTMSCGDDEPTPEAKATLSLSAIVASDPNYSDFKQFYELNSALLPDISDSTKSYTIFLPNNAAFDTLRATLDTEDLTTVAPEVIATVLAFHFVEGQKLEADFGTTFTTKQGEKITWNANNTIKEGGSNTAVEVVAANKKATNGVIHVVNRILIPPTVFLKIGINLGTMAQPVLLGSVFSDLRIVIDKADEEVPTGEKSIAQILADQSSENGYTAFLPVNDVLAAIAASKEIDKATLIASLTSSAAAARGFLLNQITDKGIYKGSDIIGSINAETNVGATYTMMSGKTYTVLKVPISAKTPAGLVLASNPQDQTTYSPIFKPDAFDYKEIGAGTNGAVHVAAILHVATEAQ